MKALALLALCSLATASDLLHVPLLCKYPQASHAAAGAIVGAIMNNVADSYDMRFIPRLVTSTVVALAVGTFKEACVDHRARWSEVPSWGAGAAVVSLCWSFKW